MKTTQMHSYSKHMHIPTDVLMEGLFQPMDANTLNLLGIGTIKIKVQFLFLDPEFYFLQARRFGEFHTNAVI